MPVTILRVGQIAGPVEEARGSPVWKRSEWLPALLLTSKNIGALPDMLPAVDWIPVDQLSHIILEIANRDAKTTGFAVYNLVNPHPQSWRELIKVAQDRFGGASKVYMRNSQHSSCWIS